MAGNLIFAFDARENAININNLSNDIVNLIEPDVITGTYYKPNVLPDPALATTLNDENKFYTMVGESLSGNQTKDDNEINYDHTYYHVRIKDIGENGLNITGAITIEMKLYINSLKGSGTNPNMVYCRRSSYSNGIICFLTSASITIGLGTGGTDRIIFNNVIQNDGMYNEWVHFVITVTNNDAKLYINGILKQTISSSEYTINLPNTNVNADLLIGSANPSATGLYSLDGSVQYVKIYNAELTQEEVTENNNENVPCFTETCNILTPKGYVNVSYLKVSDLILTSDNRKVKIKKIYKKQSYSRGYIIPANFYGINKPAIETILSANHKYYIKNKCFLPYKDLKYNKKYYTFYNILLDNYTTDYVMVNNIKMESWDGLNAL